jgi:hypothetical protein
LDVMRAVTQVKTDPRNNPATPSFRSTFRAIANAPIRDDKPGTELEATVLGAGAAGGCASWFFVPIHVVKTRMRLAVAIANAPIRDDKPGTALRLDWVLPVCSPTASLILVLTT